MAMTKPDIIDTISQYVDLKKSGRNYKALCPFHTEKTASFIVNPARQTFHCFGCNEHGDVITFVMKYYGYNFKAALRILGLSSGCPSRPDPVKIKARELKQIYRQWKHEYCLILADLLHCFDELKTLCRSMSEVEYYSHWYHKATIWELEYDVLMSNDDHAKFQLFKEKYREQRHRKRN
jgi:DNA primase catalytic core